MKPFLTVVAAAVIALATFGVAGASAAIEIDPCVIKAPDRVTYLDQLPSLEIASHGTDYAAPNRLCREFVVDVQVGTDTKPPAGFQEAFSLTASSPIDPSRCNSYRERTRLYHRHNQWGFEYVGSIERFGVGLTRDGSGCQLRTLSLSDTIPSAIDTPPDWDGVTHAYRVITSAGYYANSWLGFEYVPRTVRAAFVPAL